MNVGRNVSTCGMSVGVKASALFKFDHEDLNLPQRLKYDSLLCKLYKPIY